MILFETVNSIAMRVFATDSFYLFAAFCFLLLIAQQQGNLPLCAQNLPASSPTHTVSPRGQNSGAAHELNLSGIQFQSQGKLKEAVDCYRRAIQINSAAAGYHNNLALALKDLGELPQAESEARIALKLKPKRADYLFNLGIILQREKRLSEAESAYRQALELDSADTDCHYRLAQILMMQGGENSQEAALQEAKLALLLQPERSDYCELLGDIYLKAKNFDEAFNQYKTVVKAKNYSTDNIPGELKAKIDFIRAAIKPAL